MFRALGLKLKKRQRHILDAKETILRADLVLKHFLFDVLGISRDELGIETDYNHINKNIHIKTKNKVLANELSLSMSNLIEELNRKGIPTKKIIIE